MPGDEEKKSKPEDSKKADKNADKKDKAEPSQQAELVCGVLWNLRRNE